MDDDTVIVLLGASGDLAAKKLVSYAFILFPIYT